MFDEHTEQKINEAVIYELSNACKTYGKEYHSMHEGFAVLLEEVEEAEKELDYIKNHMAMFWDNVKTDDTELAKANVRSVAFDAVQLAKEACQIAAVARKILGEE